MLAAYNQVAGALSWFPELHGGAGGLVFVDQGSVQKWNPGTNTWAPINTTLSPLLGPYGQWSAYANGSVYVGGGNGSAIAYRVTSAATLSQVASTPINAGEGPSPQTVCAHPDGTSLLLFQAGASGNTYRFNGSSWSQTGTHSIGKDNYFFVPIPEYGVVVFVCQGANAAASTPNCRVYKP
jgi:hypothetical protein